ncbi:MAG: excinuclease ABC subunit UvrA, partial [Pseudomonadota bacterium]
MRAHLSAQGYERTLELPGQSLAVVQDRLRLSPENRDRLVEALEAAAIRGRGNYAVVTLDADRNPVDAHSFSNRRHCTRCDIDYRETTQALFSFNSPVGACPDCRGFGRVMGIDYDLVIPDANKSLRGGAIKPFQSDTNAICQRDLMRYGKRKGIDLDSPWGDLDAATQRWVIDGEDDFDTNRWYGVRRFWEWMEGRSYKMHVRVLLSRYRSYAPCGTCAGTRLVPEALAWRVGRTVAAQDAMPRGAVPGHRCDHAKLPGLHLADLVRLPISDLRSYISAIDLSSAQAKASAQLLSDIRARLDYLVEVGVGYLTLDRQSRTLSGGEVQRINLTTALGTSLVSTLFVLDEPSIGLHPRDLARVAEILRKLRDAGNTLVVVEHDPQLMHAADRIIDMGPGPGSRGGEIVFNGKPSALAKKRGSRTGAYLAGRAQVSHAAPQRVGADTAWLSVRNARAHNLKGVDLHLPLGHLTVISGVSGSGKSTLMHDVLYRGLKRLRGEPIELPGEHDSIEGHEALGELVLVDQSPIGKSARSNPASYVGAFDAIRKRFAALPLAKERGYTAGSFSFNTGLRCPSCGGTGFEHVEMQFLADVYIRCPACQGHRFRDELLEVKDLGSDGVNRSLADVLALTVTDACLHFAEDVKVQAALQPLIDVGLDYVTLGQPVPSLSAGEAQRLKLAAHLGVSQKKAKGANLFLLDEPTTGLHFDDIAKLLSALRSLQAAGHTLVLIEHNLDVIQAADYLVELGPEGGHAGGEILVAGSQQDVQAHAQSPTGRALSGAFDKPATQAMAVREAKTAYNSHDAVSIHRAREHNFPCGMLNDRSRKL